MTGPLRISAPIRAATVGRQTGRADPWLGRLVKLVPAEIVAVFLAGRPLAQGRAAGGWAAACLVLPVVGRPGGRPVRAGALRGRLPRRFPLSAGDGARRGHERSPRAAVGVRGDLRGV